MAVQATGSMKTTWVSTAMEANEANAAKTRICPTRSTNLGTIIEPTRNPA